MQLTKAEIFYTGMSFILYTAVVFITIIYIMSHLLVA